MAGFDAGTAVEKLDFTFEPYLPGVKGTIPEPPQDAVDAFSEVMAGARALLAKVDDDESSESEKAATLEVARALSSICSGAITTDQFVALPPRLRNAFAGWLMGQFANPTSASDGSTP